MKKKEKVVFDYKHPFNAPTMVREITKNFKLDRAYATQDVAVFLVTIVLCLLFFWKVAFGINSFTIMVTGLLAIGLVTLFNRYEPEGKSPFKFLWDYAKYLVQWQLPNKSLYHDEKVTLSFKKAVYDSEECRKNEVELEEKEEPTREN